MIENTVRPEQFDEFVKRINSANFRFVVGNPQRGFSSAWTAFGNASDYYIGSRAFMGSTKISLHASGICQVALTEKHYQSLPKDGLVQPPDRAFTKWKRKTSPDIGAVHVASIIFPTDYLKLPNPPTGTFKKPLFVFDAAPPGHAVEFGFFYSRENQATLEVRYLEIGYPLVCTTLENGEMVTVVARIAEFDKTWLPSQAQMDKAPGNILSKEIADIATERQNLTATFWNSPGDDGSLKLIEVGGITLRRNDWARSVCC